ncbi:MAG TPA: hypothetical protein VM285_04910 [Polyangia bacterium]|nr:hypothetical protein [Polyangia bacterium]
MRGVTTAMAVLVIGLAAAACVDNEQSFYIEHVKVLAEPPGCESNSGDAKAASALLDLALADSYFSYYYLTNGTMLRKEHDNLRAESDGILIDSMEVYVVNIDGELVGGSENYEFQMYLAPDSSDIAPGYVIPAEVVQTLAAGLGCTSAQDLAQEVFGPTAAGNPELASGFYQDIIEAIDDDVGAVYSAVRFLGHTQGGNDVETNEYSFLVQLCCNCLVNWQNCATGNNAYCVAPTEYQSCNPGVVSGSGTDVDCRLFTYGLATNWTENGLPMDCTAAESK